MRTLGFLAGLAIAATLLGLAVQRQEIVVERGADPWEGSAELPDPERSSARRKDTPARAGSAPDASRPQPAATEAGPDDGEPGSLPSGKASNDEATATADGDPGAEAGAVEAGSAGAEPDHDAVAGTGQRQSADEPSPAQSADAGRASSRPGADDTDRASLSPTPAGTAAAADDDDASPTGGRAGVDAADDASPTGGRAGGDGDEEPARRAGTPTRRWQPFWRPFNTRGSAAGFAETIARQTGIEIRPVPAGTGTYRVAYPYRDADERRAHLRRIEERAGLELQPGGEAPEGATVASDSP